MQYNSYMQNQENSNTTRFYPKNKKKLLPDTCNHVVCRSSYEEKFCRWCDNNPNVLHWSSEPIAIPYFDVIKQKERRYFPDFLIKVQDKNGNEKVWLCEIKPYKECIPPKKTKSKSKKTKLYEQTTFATNQCKWKSAIKFCKMKGWNFKLITERELF